MSDNDAKCDEEVGAVDDGGPAFPRTAGPVIDGDAYHGSQSGMSIRDWFAGKALVGLMGDGYMLKLTVGVAGAMSGRTPQQALEQPEIMGVVQQDAAKLMAQAAYRYADAMIAARGGGR